MNEVWRLVADGVLNVEDIDNVMSEGLGMRYAFLGPLETAHLNAEGKNDTFVFNMIKITTKNCVFLIDSKSYSCS